MMLMKKHLTPEVEERLKGRTTSNGVTLEKIIASGVAHPDAKVGVYIPDFESLDVFGDLLVPIIHDYHGLDDSHQEFRSDLNPDSLVGVGDLDPSGERILSTRARVARNLKSRPLTPSRSLEDRLAIEEIYRTAFSRLEGDLAGTYYSLATMTPEEQQDLRDRHLLFAEGDSHLEVAGINSDWPHGRGIFLSNDGEIFAWLNEEDERFGVIKKGGDVRSVFERLSRFITEVEKNLGEEFAFHPRYGYLAACPTNLGTGMRVSGMVQLPKLSRRPDFKEWMRSMGLQARGFDGEHSESKGGWYDVSPTERLGPTEAQIVQNYHDRVKRLLELEDAEPEA